MRDTLVSTLVCVHVVYLARLREALGCAHETIELDADATPSVEGVVATLRNRGGAWADELAPGRAVRFAVNQRLAKRDHAVADGDEVAVFPPVTGG